MTSLKNLASEQTVRLEQKNVDSYEVENCINMIIFSNYELALNEIDVGNRRFFIMNISDKRRNDTKYYSWLCEHYKKNIDYFHYYFTKMVTVDKEKIRKPIETKEKNDIIAKSNESTLISYINYILKNIFINPEEYVKQSRSEDVEEYNDENENYVYQKYASDVVDCVADTPEKELVNHVNGFTKNEFYFITNTFLKLRESDVKNNEKGEYEYPIYVNTNLLYHSYQLYHKKIKKDIMIESTLTSKNEFEHNIKLLTDKNYKIRKSSKNYHAITKQKIIDWIVDHGYDVNSFIQNIATL